MGGTQKKNKNLKHFQASSSESFASINVDSFVIR